MNSNKIVQRLSTEMQVSFTVVKSNPYLPYLDLNGKPFRPETGKKKPLAIICEN